MFGQHNYSIFLLALPLMYLTDAGSTKRLTCPASLTLLETVHIHGIYMLLYLFIFLFSLLFYVMSIWCPRCFCSIAEFSVDNSVIKPTYMLTYESASELLHLNLEEEIELKILSEAATLRLQWRQQQVILRIINTKESRVLWSPNKSVGGSKYPCP